MSMREPVYVLWGCSNNALTTPIRSSNVNIFGLGWNAILSTYDSRPQYLDPSKC